MSRQLSPAESKGNGLVNARALYLGYYMALGAFMPYINLYYERRGLSGVQIGLLSALVLLTTSATAIGWGGIADRLRLHRSMLTINLVLAPACIFLLSRANGFTAFIPIVLAYALFVAPIVPLIDSAALEAARRHGRSFGDVRVGGSIGWIISVALVGFLIQSFDIRWLFYAYIAFMLATAAFSLFQPDRQPTLQTPWGMNLRLLITDPSTLMFLASIFIVAVGSGAVQNFFSLYMDGIGAGEGVIGIVWAVAAVSEVPVMIYSGHIMRRIGAAGLLKIAIFVYALRWLLFSFVQEPAWALALQLLHGLSFAAFLTAGVTYLSERTPAGFATTSQAIFNVVCYGLASVVGSVAGGYLYDNSGMSGLFRIFSLVTAAGLALFWISSSRSWSAAYGTNL